MVTQIRPAVGTFSHFLEVANRARREASPAQLKLLRDLGHRRQLMGYQQITEEVYKIMGWS